MTGEVEQLKGLKRTRYCGELTAADANREVILCGWVNRNRDHGGVLFIDLRDRTGVVQVVFNPEPDQAVFEKASALRPEYVVAVKGIVEKRPEGSENPNLKTGDIEVRASELRILNRSKTPPFPVADPKPVDESVRLRYRYIDLRREEFQSRMFLRHRAVKFIRDFLDGEGFVEVETPYLTRGTPEGARDYLVPSRMNRGKFYALAQSPQLFKQLLMVSGFDRYFQIVRCFRDEDLRADRQPEFTQVDLEMSFVEPEDVMEVIERMLSGLFESVLGVDLELPFPRLGYREAMDRYGSDKPDTRFGLEMVDLTDVLKESEFRVFRGTIEAGGVVKGLRVPGGASWSRHQLDELTREAKEFGAKGLVWLCVDPDGMRSPALKFLSPAEIDGSLNKAGASVGDLLLFVADRWKNACEVLGALRLRIAEREGLVDHGGLKFLWVTGFPLLEWNEEEGRYDAVHHPFTAPTDEDLDILEKDPLGVRSKAYDVVLNGVELGSGSIRLHRKDVQERVFSLLGLGPEEAKAKFGFLLEALEYGAPPHGGIALGLDRLVAMMCGVNSIREVLAFPKTAKGTCLLTDAPAEVSEGQLEELGITVEREEEPGEEKRPDGYYDSGRDGKILAGEPPDRLSRP